MSSDNHTKNRLGWLDAVRSHPDLDAGAFLVAYVISGLINRERGYAWPGLSHLATETHMSPRNVKRATSALVKCGFLDRQRGGDGAPNKYRMILSVGPNVAHLDENSEANGGPTELSEGPDPAFRGAKSSIQTGHRRPPISLSISLNDPFEENISVRAQSEAGFQSDFEDLWCHYPRKASKGRARTAFKAALKRADLPTIRAGVLRYAAERSGQDPRFTKHFASWLTAECWHDEAAPAVRGDHIAPRSGAYQSGKDRTAAALRVIRGGSA